MRVTPKYVDRGVLSKSLGHYELNSTAGKQLPLRVVYYSLPGVNCYLSWQNLGENQAPKLDSRLIHGVIRPEGEPEGALLINGSQIAEGSWGVLRLAGDRLMNALQKHSQWFVLLPQLKTSGVEVFGCDLETSGAGNRELSSFLSGFTDDVIALSERLLVVNPYYKSGGFLAGDGLALTRGMSTLVGRSIIKGVAAGLHVPLRPEVVDYFAAAFSLATLTDFIDVARVLRVAPGPDRQLNAFAAGLPEPDEMKQTLPGLVELGRALFPLVTPAEARLTNFILNR